MAKKENKTEIPKTEVVNKAPVPIGFTAKTDGTAFITFQQFFDLMRVMETMNNLINFIKQENFNKGSLKYYFEEDLVDVKDKDGNVIMVKGENGVEIPQKELRQNFWD